MQREVTSRVSGDNEVWEGGGSGVGPKIQYLEGRERCNYFKL